MSPVSLRTLGTIEGGRSRVFLGNLHVIAAALSVPFESLVAGHLAPSPPPIAPDAGNRFQLPSLTPDFIGREIEVREIVDSLRLRTGRPSVSALCGMGGIGKTTVAVQAAYLAKDQFSEAQLFLDLHGVGERPLTTADAMTAFIRALCGEVPNLPLKDADLLPIYRSALSGKRVLLVLDNAKDDEQICNLIAGDKSAFIITSRNALAIDGAKLTRLEIFSNERSLDFLRKIVKSKGSDEELRRVAEICDSLPLALRVAGDFLRLKGDWSVDRYIRSLENEALRWLKVGTSTEKNVAFVLNLSARQLVQDNLDLALRWHFLADWPADFELASITAAWDMDVDADRALEDLSELVDRSMVLFDERTSRYRLHDLMKPIGAGLFQSKESIFSPHDYPPLNHLDQKRRSDQRAARFFAHVLTTANNLYQHGGDKIIAALSVYDSEIVNFRHFQEVASRLFSHNKTDEFLSRTCRDFAIKGSQIAHFRLHATEWIRWLEVGLCACQSMRDRNGEGNIQNSLGLAWMYLGQASKALGFYQQSLAIAKETDDFRGESLSLNNLANACVRVGRIKEAIGYYKQSLTIARKYPDHQNVGLLLNNLGLALLHLGDIEKAIEFYQESLEIARSKGDSRGVAQALTNIASAYVSAGHAAPAVKFYEQSLTIARKNRDRRSEGQILNNFGIACTKLGQPAKALEFFEESLAIGKESGDRTTEAQALQSLGNYWDGLGEPVKAISFYEQSLVIAQEIGDPNGEGIASYNLADTLASSGRLLEAIPKGERALALFEALESPTAATVRNSLAKWRAHS